MAETKTVSVIFGTRPEAIKLAPVILGMKNRDRLRCRICVTAQHRQMLDDVLAAFDIEPDVDLDLMRPNQSLAGLTSRAITSLDDYLSEDHPDLVLVQGDTTTVFSAALAAFYHQIPVGHVEAGLRTGNRFSPFPEEINRVLCSRLTDLHFAPTDTARKSLLDEGISEMDVFVTGNTVIDALQLAVERTRRDPPEIPGLSTEQVANFSQKPTILVTAHRRENFGKGFEDLCSGIARLAERYPDAEFVYPVHLNPNVREPVFRRIGNLGNVHLIEPLSYLPFVTLMDRCRLVLTDSGGIQEEAPTLGKPVLVMRDTTERPEGVEAGTAKLVGTDPDAIVTETAKLLDDPQAYDAMARAINPYGDGKAHERILDILEERL